MEGYGLNKINDFPTFSWVFTLMKIYKFIFLKTENQKNVPEVQ